MPGNLLSSKRKSHKCVSSESNDGKVSLMIRLQHKTKKQSNQKIDSSFKVNLCVLDTVGKEMVLS